MERGTNYGFIIYTNYGFIITRRRQDDSSVSGSPTLSVPPANIYTQVRMTNYVYTSQDDKICTQVRMTKLYM